MESWVSGLYHRPAKTEIIVLIRRFESYTLRRINYSKMKRISDLITEMAYSRKDYLNRVDDLFSRIAVNWCLINYCKLYNPNNYNYKHWKTEFSADIKKIQKMKAKQNDSKETRTKYITQSWIENAEYNDPKVIIYIIEDELVNKENIPSSIVPILVNNLVGEMKSIIGICVGGKIELERYLGKI